MKFLYYEGRHGEQILTEHSPTAFEFLKEQMQEDNRATFDEIKRDMGYEAFYGDFEYLDNAYLSIDDGGSIETIELTEVSCPVDEIPPIEDPEQLRLF